MWYSEKKHEIKEIIDDVFGYYYIFNTVKSKMIYLIEINELNKWEVIKVKVTMDVV